MYVIAAIITRISPSIAWFQTGLGTSLKIMGLATIDPYSHNVQTKLFKIPKFDVNRPNSKQDTAIWKCPNPDAIHFFINF